MDLIDAEWDGGLKYIRTAACPPGWVNGTERQRAPRERVGTPSEESGGGVGPCSLARAGGRGPRRVAAGPRGATGCAAAGRHSGAARRLPGSALEQQRVVNLAPEVPARDRCEVGLHGGHFPAGPLRGGGPGRDTAHHYTFALPLRAGGAWTGARRMGHLSAVRSAHSGPARARGELGTCKWPMNSWEPWMHKLVARV
ncbi:hypothetical protein NDU88_006674 [Pleurodeles waltl]|uniref:Uncharacterized protein n=1 Tax=Pleurodeles waltl TaxID=8319 RepID=A0AAV7LTD7_PLEWA|nr:hypothetical protein NDU88_006674 [Pleurodeles waltl]